MIQMPDALIYKSPGYTGNNGKRCPICGAPLPKWKQYCSPDCYPSTYHPARPMSEISDEARARNLARLLPIVEQGDTLDVMGDRLGLTRQRVSALIKRYRLTAIWEAAKAAKRGEH